MSDPDYIECWIGYKPVSLAYDGTEWLNCIAHPAPVHIPFLR